ncbi:MAG: hypothetical protein H0X28_01395 [Solirubrobacterales bacterium]|nr:hypothetical protein [Solirubrobacterales bacterium]
MARPKGPIDYDLESLTPDRFGSLVALLARAVDPLVVPVRAKDHGLDARLPTLQGATRRGWQAKRFTTGIHWGQCRDSVERAIAFWRVPWITFCFAHDLSGSEQEAFKRELNDTYPQVRLNFWPATELQRLMRDSEEGRRAAAWVFDNPEADRDAMLRAMSVGGELASTAHAAERQAVIQQYMDRDPHLQYTIVSRSAGAPETPPAREAVLSVTLGVAGQEIRIDGSERYPGALADLGGGPGVLFSDDEQGRQAQETIERLVREGGKETINAGLGAGMPQIPVGLQGLMPEGGIWGAAEVEASGHLRASDPAPLGQFLLCVGDQEIGVTLDAVETGDGWDGTIGGGVGGLEIFQSVRKRGARFESQLDWRYTRGIGSALEQLVACDAVLAALSGTKVELRALTGQSLVEASLDPPPDTEEWKEELASITGFLGYVAELEAWTGERIEPPSHPSEHDVAALGEAIGRIRQPEAPLTWQRIELDPGAIEPEMDGPFQFAWTRPLWIRLFGSEIYLGGELLHFPEGRLVREGGTLVVEPYGSEGTGTARFLHPDEAPAEAMQPPTS